MDKQAVVVSKLIDVLIDIGAKFRTSSASVDEILWVLDSIEEFLSPLRQASPNALEPAMKELISDKFFRHPDVDVKVSVLSCIHELIRISAPNPPYGDDEMKEIFQQTLIAFEHLSSLSGRCYNKTLLILETVAKVRSCMMLLDLGCDSLIIQIFQKFLDTIKSNHPEAIFSYMEGIMTQVIEEVDEISLELLGPLLICARNDNMYASPPARRLAVKVLRNCGARVKPYVVETMEIIRRDAETYRDIIASIMTDTPAADMVASILPDTPATDTVASILPDTPAGGNVP